MKTKPILILLVGLLLATVAAEVQAQTNFYRPIRKRVITTSVDGQGNIDLTNAPSKYLITDMVQWNPFKVVHMADDSTQQYIRDSVLVNGHVESRVLAVKQYIDYPSLPLIYQDTALIFNPGTYVYKRLSGGWTDVHVTTVAVTVLEFAP